MWRQIFIFSEKCVGQQLDTKCLCTLNTDDCQVLCLWKQIFIVFEQLRVHWTLNKGSRQKKGKIFTLCEVRGVGPAKFGVRTFKKGHFGG